MVLICAATCAAPALISAADFSAAAFVALARRGVALRRFVCEVTLTDKTVSIQISMKMKAFLKVDSPLAVLVLKLYASQLARRNQTRIDPSSSRLPYYYLWLIPADLSSSDIPSQGPSGKDMKSASVWKQPIHVVFSEKITHPRQSACRSRF
jgi:hypothetical protein